jgi:hypothetical protein
LSPAVAVAVEKNGPAVVVAVACCTGRVCRSPICSRMVSFLFPLAQAAPVVRM